MSVEDESSIPSADCTIAEAILSQLLGQFMRLSQIQVPMTSRMRIEPIVDYSHLQILTSNNHVDHLRRILEKRATVEEKKVIK